MVVAVVQIVYARRISVFVHDFVQDAVCLFCIAWFVPAFCCEKQSSDKIQFSVGCVAAACFSAVGPALPAEISVPRRSCFISHVAFGPFPQFVELLAPVKLYAYHHAVRHAFGAHVVVARVHYKCCPVGVLIVDGAFAVRFVAAQVARSEKMVPYLVKTRFHFFVGLAEQCREKILGICRKIGHASKGCC